MRIDAITSCVGSMYANFLKQTISVWLDTLDSLTIVTQPNDPITEVSRHSNLCIVETDIFTKNEAYFNKGAALNEAYIRSNPKEWVLSFDADISPPKEWRVVTEQRAKQNCINGAFRFCPRGRCIDPKVLLPKGYFQLWHMEDTHYRREPLFDDWHTHAAAYDTHFYEQWPKELRNDLKIRLTHLGQHSTHWFGVGADPKLMEWLTVQRRQRNRAKK